MARTTTALILDIDSGSVGACIVTLTKEKPIMSDVMRVPMGNGELRDVAVLIPKLKEALTTLMPHYTKANPTEVWVMVASPWFGATLRTLSSKSDKPVRVSKSSVERVVSDYRKSEVGVHPLESVPISVVVNGYQTNLATSVLGKTLAVTLYESTADQQFVATVTDAVHATLAHAQVRFHTTPLVYAETILALSGEEHGTVIDVGSEVSDVIVLSKRAVAFVGSVPFGSHTLARSVATKVGPAQSSLSDSMTRLVMFVKNELADKDMQAVAAALTDVAVPWQTAFNDVLATAGNTVPVPHRFFLVGEKDELLWFEQVATTSSTRVSVPPTKVLPDFFKSTLTFGEGGVFDSSLALGALFFHMRGSSNTAHAVNERVVYSIQ